MLLKNVEQPKYLPMSRESWLEQRKDEASTPIEELQFVEVGFGALQLIVLESMIFVDPSTILLAQGPTTREITEHDLHIGPGQGTIKESTRNHKGVD